MFPGQAPEQAGVELAVHALDPSSGRPLSLRVLPALPVHPAGGSTLVTVDLLSLHVPWSLPKPLPPHWPGRSPLLTGEGPTLRVSHSSPG